MEYGLLGECFRTLVRRAQEGVEGALLLEAAREVLAPTLMKGTLHGFAHLKPHGYHGDFELLEKLLSFHHSTDPNLVRWDRYCHALPSVRALRARAGHLRTLLLRLEGEGEQGPVRVMHFRSGPAREFADYFIARAGATCLRCDCVDADAGAILHGRRNVARLTDRITFHHAPLLRFRAAHGYRLIWVSSLCEMLDDRAFVAVVRRLMRQLEPGGWLVLCQLASPQEAVMDDTGALLEILGDWRLQLRDARTLEQLAIEAGGYPDVVRVVSDPQHPNLFLHVQRPIGPLRRRLRKRAPLRLLEPVVATFPPSPSLLGDQRWRSPARLDPAAERWRAAA